MPEEPQDSFDELPELPELTDADAPVEDAPAQAQAPQVQRFGYDEIDNSAYFAVDNADRLRYVADDQEWRIWTGTHWARSENDTEVKRLAIASIDARLAEATTDAQRKSALGLRTQAKVNATISLAKARAEVSAVSEDFDRYPYRLSVANGEIDLRSGAFTEGHRRDSYATACVPLKYDASCGITKWLQYLDDVTDGDSQLIDWLQVAIGYSLTGDASKQCFFMLVGQTQTGKGTLLRILRKLTGDYGVEMDADLLVDNHATGSHSSNLYQLKGKRVWTVDETPIERKPDVKQYKQLTGGGKIPVREIFKPVTEMTPIGKMWLSANGLPNFRADASGAFARRIKIVPFNAKLAVINNHLEEELEAELPGILAWAVAGAHRFYAANRTFPACAVVDNAVTSAKSDDDFTRFLDEYTIFEPDSEVEISELFYAWRKFCSDENIRDAGQQRGFGEKLKQRHGIGSTPIHGKRYYRGIRFASESIAQAVSAFRITR